MSKSVQVRFLPLQTTFIFQTPDIPSMQAGACEPATDGSQWCKTRLSQLSQLSINFQQISSTYFTKRGNHVNGIWISGPAGDDIDTSVLPLFSSRAANGTHSTTIANATLILILNRTLEATTLIPKAVFSVCDCHLDSVPSGNDDYNIFTRIK